MHQGGLDGASLALENACLSKPVKPKARSLKPLGLSGYKIQPPKGQKAFEIETADDMFPLHMLLVAVAKRGGGKTTAVCNLLRMMHQEGSLDRVLAITSTYESNVPQFEGIPLGKEDVFHPEDPEAIQHIVDIIESERRDYDTYWERMRTWQAMRKAMKQVNTDRDIFNVQEQGRGVAQGHT
jgi:Mrp family chromosome partitioning ATPase